MGQMLKCEAREEKPKAWKVYYRKHKSGLGNNLRE